MLTDAGQDPVTKQWYSVRMEPRPFAEGALRLAFEGRLMGAGPRNGALVVVKTLKSGVITDPSKWVPELKVSQVAASLAAKFNDAVASKLPNEPRISFVIPIISKVSDLS